MTRGKIITSLLAAALCFTSLHSWDSLAGEADSLVVIVNPESGVTSIDREDMINIFMGRYRQFPTGLTAIPVDYVPAKENFYEMLIDKKLSEVNAYWARLVFSGRATPPLQLQTPGELLEFVSSNRGAIGYIERGELDNRVRILTTLTTGN